MSVINNTAANRFELNVDGHIAFADYLLDGRVLVIPHVEAPAELRGTGAAGKLMEGVVEAARSANQRIRPLCSYAAAWIKRHPEHHDLLA